MSGISLLHQTVLPALPGPFCKELADALEHDVAVGQMKELVCRLGFTRHSQKRTRSGDTVIKANHQLASRSSLITEPKQHAVRTLSIMGTASSKNVFTKGVEGSG